MKFKLDENFDPRLASIVAEGGHDVDTVRGEGLSGRSESDVFDACRRLGRVLVTLDLDFANPLRFPPGGTAGIVVLRPPRPLVSVIRSVLSSALPTLKSQPLEGSLWIVEPGRIRRYDPAPDEADQ